jgi:hypothetical protein
MARRESSVSGSGWAAGSSQGEAVAGTGRCGQRVSFEPNISRSTLKLLPIIQKNGSAKRAVPARRRP